MARSKKSQKAKGSSQRNTGGRKRLSQRALSKATILLSFVAIITSLAIYYLSYATPNIRSASTKLKVNIRSVSVDDNGDTLLYIILKDGFTNHSVKHGYLDKIEFVPNAIDIIPRIDVQGIDKSILYCGETKEIEMSVILRINPYSRELMDMGKSLTVKFKTFDNMGQVIMQDKIKEPYFLDFELKSSKTPGDKYYFIAVPPQVYKKYKP
jgi:preprotein translocase subunit SecG